jgi:hypothetical protein
LSVNKVRRKFAILFFSTPCPACQAVYALRTHASYWKYYYAEPLRILRCICSACQVTHAVIPSFSVPGTSIGTEEAEAYITLREQRNGRRKAAKVFNGEKAMSENYPAVLDKAFRTAVDRAKAIFSGKVDERLQGTAWIEKLTGQRERPIVSLNQYCLEHQVNCICLTRFRIHLFRKNTPGSPTPHNNGAWHCWKVVVDSW